MFPERASRRECDLEVRVRDDVLLVHEMHNEDGSDDRDECRRQRVEQTLECARGRRSAPSEDRASEHWHDPTGIKQRIGREIQRNQQAERDRRR
jgi:hypothetical protein